MTRIEFSKHPAGGNRVHYVNEEDVFVVLGRLPHELWSRLRRVLFTDHAQGIRVLGYTALKGRSEISLCALPQRLSLNHATLRTSSSKEFGALRGSQWPILAVRRFMLYHVLLKQIGHLQEIDPRAKNPNRRFASETKAQEFANYWRQILWSFPYEHQDKVHDPPSPEEIEMLRMGWTQSNLAFKKGLDLENVGKSEQALNFYSQAVSLYPNHEQAVSRLSALEGD